MQVCGTRLTTHIRLRNSPKKISSSTVFENANNFITGIQFLTHRLVTKKLGTPKHRETPPNNPYLFRKYEKKFYIRRC